MATTNKTKEEKVEVVEENFMRLEQYIELLQELLKAEGNLPVTYATDDEGNSHGYNRYAPMAVFYGGLLDGHRQHLEILDEKDVIQTKQVAFKAICVN